MGYRIDIDASQFATEHSLKASDMTSLAQAVARGVATRFAYNWKSVASRELNQTREQFTQAINVKHDGNSSTVYLNPNAFIPNAIEGGMAPYDMKVGMLNSPKAKVSSKGNRYLIIPFRFAVEGSVGTRADFAGVMPKEISQMMQSAKVGATLGLGAISQKHRMPKSVELRNKIKAAGLDMGQATAQLDESEQTSKYEGLRRNAKGSGYVNFRIVSDLSPSDAFMHPGFERKDFLGTAMRETNLDHEAKIIADNFLQGLI